MSTRIWVSTSPTRSMRSTRRPSIFVWRSFRGRISARPKPAPGESRGRRSRCTRCWTCAATSRASSTCRMASCTTLTRSTPAFARAGSAAPGGGRDLRHGSGLCRFRPAPCAAPGRSLLRHPCQIEHGCSSGLFRRGRPHDRHHLRSDHRPLPPQGQALDGHYTTQHYPEHLRRIRFRDAETGKKLVFLTNQFGLPAATICDLYRSRWKVELFFKWIKQHLRIKRFYGTSENAVKTQIWIAVSVYVLVAIVRKRLTIEASLYTLMQVFSVAIFEKAAIKTAFSPDVYGFDGNIENKQLNLFSF